MNKIFLGSLLTWTLVIVLAEHGIHAGGASARRDRVAAITGEYDKQFVAFVDAAKSAMTDAERDAAEKRRPSIAVFAKRLLDAAKEQPADDASCDALVWIASHYGGRQNLEMSEALDLLEKHHLASPKLKNSVASLVFADSPRANAFALTLAEKAGDRTVRGMACLFLGYAAFERTGGADGKSQAEVERWMQRVTKDYADVRWENRTLGDRAEAQLFEIRNLIPGRTAPEIEGATFGGKKVKLSEQRGKVVMLVFWGSWCGPCMAEIPHLHELTKKHARRPFTVFGINGGDTAEHGAKVARKESMSWPVIFDGDDGPIVRKWNVTGFPTIYLIDAAGVIRAKGKLGDEDPERTLDRLIIEAERKR